MKCLFYLILFLFSFYANSALYNINKSYQGDPFFGKVNIQKLEDDCSRRDDYWSLNQDEQLKDDKRCPLHFIRFDYGKLYELIDKNPIIYKNNDFQLKLSTKLLSGNYREEGNGEITLSLIHNHQEKDKIYLADDFISDGSHACGGWAAYQRYYISNNGNIYTLLLTETEDGIYPSVWKHYKIDSKNMKFILTEMLINKFGTKFKIIYPNKFDVIPNNKSLQEINEQNDDPCYCQGDDYCNCHLGKYNHYQSLFDNKIKGLNNKIQTKKKSLLKNKINSICLSLSPPNYKNEVSPYLVKVLSCFIDEFKKEIETNEENI